MKQDLVDDLKKLAGGRKNLTDDENRMIENAVSKLDSKLASSITKSINHQMYGSFYIHQCTAINELVNDYSLLLKNLKLVNSDSDYYLNLIKAEKMPVRKLKLLFQLLIEHNVG
jgi:hypothetical protein